MGARKRQKMIRVTELAKKHPSLSKSIGIKIDNKRRNLD